MTTSKSNLAVLFGHFHDEPVEFTRDTVGRMGLVHCHNVAAMCKTAADAKVNLIAHSGPMSVVLHQHDDSARTVNLHLHDKDAPKEFFPPNPVIGGIRFS